jgi:hypothetical protein
VPGAELVVDRHAPAHRSDAESGLAVRETFDDLRRQLQDYARKLRGAVKQHDETAG